ncbi:DUF2304 domain-containing protein [Candidatus Magnetomonas plexicatena]|uniref:DUF2304 domain-containing protein n=1 Tax=Candidatus Magnetomonas plexicatena TaxID=2552947 RepID=UPI001C74F558|nr:DUF2304 domain-containing protein [Nitrospirales bacterium LBB_01]
MSTGSRVLIVVLGVVLFTIIFELVRRRKFREEHSLLWFVVSVCIISGAFLDNIVNRMATFLGVGYPPIIVLVILTVLLILSLMYFSIIISDLKGKIKELNQKIAFLEYEIKNPHKESK